MTLPGPVAVGTPRPGTPYPITAAGLAMPVRRGEPGGAASGPARFLSLFRRMRADSDPVRLVHTAGDGESPPGRHHDIRAGPTGVLSYSLHDTLIQAVSWVQLWLDGTVSLHLLKSESPAESCLKY